MANAGGTNRQKNVLEKSTQNNLSITWFRSFHHVIYRFVSLAPCYHVTWCPLVPEAVMVKWWCDVSRSNVTLSKIQPMSCDYGILCQYVMKLLQYLSTNRVRTGDLIPRARRTL